MPNLKQLQNLRRMYRIGVFCILAIIGLIGWILWSNQCNKISCISTAESSTWQEKDIYEHTKKVFRAMYEAPKYRIRIEKRSQLSQSDATLLTKVETMKIAGLFDRAASPYPGVISDKIICDESYKPEFMLVQNASLNITYYQTWLNDRLQPGSCLESDKKFKSHNARFYCKNEKALYHLEFITRSSDNHQNDYFATIQTIRCQNRF